MNFPFWTRTLETLRTAGTGELWRLESDARTFGLNQDPIPYKAGLRGTAAWFRGGASPKLGLLTEDQKAPPREKTQRRGGLLWAPLLRYREIILPRPGHRYALRGNRTHDLLAVRSFPSHLPWAVNDEATTSVIFTYIYYNQNIFRLRSTFPS